MPRDASITVGTLPGGFPAAEIEGLQPDDAADASTRAVVRDALWEHGVACLRFDRALDDDEVRTIATIIGPIKDPIGRTRTGDQLRYSEDRQIIDAGFVLTDELREQLGDVNFGGLDPMRPGLFETFHTDDSYVERPAAATVLHALELPSVPGGDTHFIDMRAAYQLLEPALRARLAGLNAVNTYNNRGAFPSRVSAEGPFEELEDVILPIVRAHPVTGEPSLYIDLDRATGIDGMPDDEARALLQLLQEHAEQRAPRYAHRWRPHDVLMWDNATVQHKAGGDFPVGEPRRFWRYMIEGPRPVAFTG